MSDEVAKLNARIGELERALRAVIGHGYLETKFPAGQDYVSKEAIAQVRRALRTSSTRNAREKQHG